MRHLFAALLAALSWLTTSNAQAAWPDKPVYVVVPFPPGAADSATRVLAKKLGDYWGQPVVIENKPGAAGVFHAAHARPDGYTLLLGAGSLIVTAPLLNKKLPYDPQRDLVPVAQILTNTPILTSHPSLGVKSVQELVAYAKKNPGVLNYGSSGVGSPGHLIMEMFTSITDTKIVHVPYKGGGPSVSDLLAGHVQLGINATPSVLPQIKAGKLVPLAVANSKRDRALPEVPTMAEAGVPKVEFTVWYGLFAPAKTPPATVAKISADVARALAEPDVAQQITAQGSEPAPMSPAQFTASIQKERAIWQKLIKDKNLTLEE